MGSIARAHPLARPSLSWIEGGDVAQAPSPAFLASDPHEERALRARTQPRAAAPHCANPLSLLSLLGRGAGGEVQQQE